MPPLLLVLLPELLPLALLDELVAEKWETPEVDMSGGAGSPPEVAAYLTKHGGRCRCSGVAVGGENVSSTVTQE